MCIYKGVNTCTKHKCRDQVLNGHHNWLPLCSQPLTHKELPHRFGFCSVFFKKPLTCNILLLRFFFFSILKRPHTAQRWSHHPLSFDEIRLEGSTARRSPPLWGKKLMVVEIKSWYARVWTCVCFEFVCTCVCARVCVRLTNPSAELKRVKNTSKGSLTSVKPHRDFENNKWWFSSLFPGGLFSPLRRWLFHLSPGSLFIYLFLKKPVVSFLMTVSSVRVCVRACGCVWERICACVFQKSGNGYVRMCEQARAHVFAHKRSVFFSVTW